MALLLGCIADDFTGATDLAGILVESGIRTVQVIGVPSAPADIPDAEAVVIALKSRTVPTDEAVSQSLAALQWLRNAGCGQFYFKYCSTFDSTDKGNIGPVAEALLDALDSDFSIASPAFPVNKRTVFKGYLFVGDVLLNESGMQHHPLTPMTDSSLVRVLDRQTSGGVGLVAFDTVRAGAESIRAAFEELRRDGVRMAIVDALDDSDLRAIGAASHDLKLITGGSGIAIGLADNFRRQGLLETGGKADELPRIGGKSAVLAGSCSSATQGQVAIMKKQWPSYRIDPLAVASGGDVVAEILSWAVPKLEEGPVLIYSTAAPDDVADVQGQLGVQNSGELIEKAMAQIAKGLVEAGVRKLVVAGGETSGAVVGELGVEALRIGAQIAPGVPWTVALSDPPLALALKSGNFGSPRFFLEAFEMSP